MLLEPLQTEALSVPETTGRHLLRAAPYIHAAADSAHRYFSPSGSLRRQKAEVHLHSAENVHTAISGRDAKDRAELEGFVHDIFARAYGADVREFMPFLERYLNQPVEQMIAEKSGQAVARQDIVEIGNLAVAHPETSRSLLASISLYLHGTNTAWGVFTGIPSLRNSLSKLNMLLLPLGIASLSHLPQHEHAAWGTYYDEKPHVMAVQRLQPARSAV